MVKDISQTSDNEKLVKELDQITPVVVDQLQVTIPANLLNLDANTANASAALTEKNAEVGGADVPLAPPQTLITTEQIVETMKKQGVDDAEIKRFLDHVKHSYCKQTEVEVSTHDVVPPSIMSKKFTVQEAFSIVAFLGLSAAVVSALMNFTGSAAIVTALSVFGQGMTFFKLPSASLGLRSTKGQQPLTTNSMIFWCGGLLYLGYSLASNFF